MKVLVIATVLALGSLSVSAAETVKKKVTHDVEHHHVEEGGDAHHSHEDAHHKDHDHKAHHPSHEADVVKHEMTHKQTKKVSK